MTRVSIITGADGNLGRAVAATLAARGDALVLTGLHADALHSAYADWPDVQLVDADLASRSGAAKVVAEALHRYGRIDNLCHLAGGFAMGTPVHGTPDDRWSFLQVINVDSLRRIAAETVPVMLKQERGAIVTVGAFAALHGAGDMGAYCAAKAVVQRLTESMSHELKRWSINVNCVLPSILDTPQNRAAMPNASFEDWVAPADLARVIAFLASDDSIAVHGAAIPVTGKV